MTINEATEALRAAGVPSAEWDAKELYRYATGLDPTLSARNENVKCALFDEYVKRRTMREPLQYIVGEVFFYRERYTVNKNVLIPRSDTEILVDEAVKRIPKGELFVDLCTGSGCIAVSTLKNTNKTRAIAVDISEAALQIAQKNAEQNGVGERLELLKLDLLSEFPVFDKPPFAILSNPPYVSEEDYTRLEPELYSEPRLALVAKNRGLEFYERLIPLALRAIQPNGFIALEIGYDQGPQVCEIANSEGAHTEIIKDYSNNDRVVLIRKTNP